MKENVATQCPLPEGLRTYIVRGDDMVPLIPADQLPFQLQGIPRCLTPGQMLRENWKSHQETNHTATPLLVLKPSSISPSRPSPAPTPRFLAADHRVRTEPATTSEEKQTKRWSAPPRVPEKEPFEPTCLEARPLDSLSAMANKFASIYSKDAKRINYRMPYPSGVEPDPSKKVYCSYWIRTGECDFTVQGCKYKHEMPPIDKLREMGLLSVPEWYKKMTAIAPRTPTWMQLRLAAGNDNDEGGDTPCSRLFPDPSTLKTQRPDDREPLRLPEPTTRRFLRGGSQRATAPPVKVVSSPSTDSSSRRDSQISDLLIDLSDNTPVSTPSLEPSKLSTSADASDVPAPPKHVLVPPTQSAAEKRTETSTTVSAVSSTPAEQANKKGKKTPQLPANDHRSSISLDSDSEQCAIPIETSSKRGAPRYKRLSSKPLKQLPDIANSKHAPASATASTRTQSRNADAHAQNSKRAIPQQQKNHDGGDAKTELSSRVASTKERNKRHAACDRRPHPPALPAAIERLV